MNKKISNKLLNNKSLTRNETIQILMWAYFGVKGSVKKNRNKNFTHCGAGIECALIEAYQCGVDSVKGKNA